MAILNSNYGYPKFKTILDIHLDKTFKDILKQADLRISIIRITDIINSS